MAKKDSKESKKKNGELKKKSSMRESAAKSREAANKPKRVRKAAQAASKPVGKFKKAMTTEYHLFGSDENRGFFTKSRSFIPSYFTNSAKELKQVTWPGRSETWRLVFAVFVFALILGSFIAILDYGLEKLLREVIL